MRSKTTLLLSVFVLASFIMALRNPNNFKADNLNGAWQFRNNNEEHVVLFMDGYFTHTTYNKGDRKFVQTRGGTYSLNNNTF
ncbi:MAG TPA: hypothetical protein VGB71_10615, partial [Flavisolibacter sp.]